MAKRGVPTARWGRFERVDEAVAFVDQLDGRVVVKADGLAAGKGVTVAADRDEAAAAIHAWSRASSGLRRRSSWKSSSTAPRSACSR